ncbi:ribonuclease domain-containing protein [Streptacidiphilus rugosus]|uniref:ribonuclease domain-containing protein n=1 Tax=Streptacidiphilus rugosus TaxID=405783 RepID=UPI0005683167|nr:ribonuclease domain-containing protein [Streptacidiphilus rugosus]
MTISLRAWNPRTTSLALAVGVLVASGSVLMPAATAHADVSGSVCQSALPPEADDTLGLIAQGGPYPYRQDDSVFSNNEGVLPGEPYGYYHEYTVVTPGSATRGARRIVVDQPDQLDYYTDDHYTTFALIDFSC